MTKIVYVLGARDLFKDLLCEAVQEKVGLKCIVARNVHLALKDDNGDAGVSTRLLLLDGSSPSLAEMLMDIKLATQVERASFITALYNVETGTDTEREALLRGVKGFFRRNETIKLFCKGVKALFAGEIWMPRETLMQLAARQASSMTMSSLNGVEKSGLTKREMEILSCVTVGWTNDEIATRLNLSSHTVKTHLYRVFKKINVGNRFQASLWAAKNM